MKYLYPKHITIITTGLNLCALIFVHKKITNPSTKFSSNNNLLAESSDPNLNHCDDLSKVLVLFAITTLFHLV